VKRYKEGMAIIASLVFFICAPSIKAQYLQDGTTYAQNKIIIAIKSEFAPINPVAKDGMVVTGLADLDNLNRQYAVTNIWPLFPKAEQCGEYAMAGYYSISFGPSLSLEAALSAYDQLPSIDHVEPIGIHRLDFTPNDYYLTTQWAITRIDARQAWDITRGDSAVALGIADTGVDWNHPDLDGNIWYNSGETLDGVDNDANGYIDDIRGWDWVTGQNGWPGEDDNTPDNNPMDFYGHGTHCAGIASAETNNSTGIAGLGFNCKIMCLRIGWYDISGLGLVDMSYAASAMYYAARKGAKAINCSWGSSNSGGLSAAVTYAVNNGVVVVSAAGNDSSQIAPYLCGRSQNDVIAVAATNSSDHVADFSNFGTWVDVCAPGVNIYSTYFDNTYTFLDGTSMAAPHVVGLVGLIASAAPYMTRAQIQSRIISTTEDIYAINPSGYAGKLGSGRINAYNAVNGLGSPIAIPLPQYPPVSAWVNTPHPTIIWADTAQATVYHFQIDDQSAYSSPLINDSTLTDTSLYVADSLTDTNFWYWRVRAGNGSFWTDYCSSQNFRIDTRKPNTTTLLSPVLNSWTSDRTPSFSWQSVTDVGGSGISKYFIEIDSDSLFAAPHLIDDSSTTTSFTSAINLPENIRVFWRVRARDRAGNFADYASSAFNLDNAPPDNPIGFNALPDGWTTNPSFTLSWTNPFDTSGIAIALYKIGAPPTSNYDTTGHLSSAPPAIVTVLSTGGYGIYVWLADGLGNTTYAHRAQDSLKFDNTPPAGSIASSPLISGTLSFTVHWSQGSDVGSGLSGFYDVRYKEGVGGIWTDWEVNIEALSALFSGVHGHTYFFESRARDLAGNLEPFIGVSETQTDIDTTFTGPAFVPGDVNGSGDVNGLDVVYLVNYLKGIGPIPPDPILRADANGSCAVNGIDVSYLVIFLKGGPAPFAGNCR
jgi:subtilisin family serine protease